MSDSMWEAARDYVNARQYVQDTESRLNGARCELANARNALGKLVAPEDMKEGETICVWVRIGREDTKRLLNVRKDGMHDYACWFRGEPEPYRPQPVPVEGKPKAA